MANNFGLGSRSMKKAGAFALKNAVLLGHLSFASDATIKYRWNRFCDWAKESNEIKKMEQINFALVQEYGEELALEVGFGDLAVSTAQNYLSAINTVMDLAAKGRWKGVSPTLDCKIPQRSFVRTTVPSSLDRARYSLGIDEVRAQLGERAAAIVCLCREFGFRSKEASLFDARSAAEKAKIGGYLVISAGTKGGRDRTLPILNIEQLAAINLAASVQSNDKSLIPIDQDWRIWREGYLRDIRELIQKTLNATGLHDLRAAYACERYKLLTGCDAPVTGSSRAQFIDDQMARQTISEELGHARLQISNAYVGGGR